jgi:hypothetical protein
MTVHVVLGKKQYYQINQLYNVYCSFASIHLLLLFHAEAFQLACPEISAELIAANVAITVGTVCHVAVMDIWLRPPVSARPATLQCGPRSMCRNKEQEDMQFDE